MPIYYAYMIFLFFSGRVLLFILYFILYFDRFKDNDVHYWLTFLYGLRMDTIVASMLLVIPLAVFSLMPERFRDKAPCIIKFYFLITMSVLIFIELCTFPFFAEYDIRPNYLFVEYLKYPDEVLGMIMSGYRFEAAVIFGITIFFIWFFLKKASFNFNRIFHTVHGKRLLVFFPAALILFMGIRSSTGHRPANISDAMYSSNRVVNEITQNSAYSLGYAVYAAKKYQSGGIDAYGKMEFDKALKRVKACLNIQSKNSLSPLSREVKTHFPGKNSKNLVILLEESLGYQFVEALGGEKGITPNLNRLSREGLLFTNTCSNGTRSIRGIAGVVSGIFSIPGKGVVKRNKSQKDFFTIASLLEPFGYETLFLYGGESRFDNMKGWFSGNGFDRIIDEPKFKNPEFTGTWGVSDGDLVRRANEEFKRLYQKHQKFAAVMFSTSNHTPFDFPRGKVDLIKGVPLKSVKNAVKYADYAIGEFIRKAKKEAYYKDTVFVIIADHNVRVYGNDMVPVDMFHIPALILCSDIASSVYTGLSTQPDVLATALDLIGLDLNYPVMGHSIFSDKKQEVALMQFNDNYALQMKNKVAVIRPDKAPLTFVYENRHLKPAAHDAELEKNALAFVVTLNRLYNDRSYKTQVSFISKKKWTKNKT
ncbi:MAG: LTA synthase family protein [Thermodesulfobacteriota bacterium]|nr:LTA synthase family protein [Thermodesulfobacteriota bacterium]